VEECSNPTACTHDATFTTRAGSFLVPHSRKRDSRSDCRQRHTRFQSDVTSTKYSNIACRKRRYRQEEVGKMHGAQPTLEAVLRYTAILVTQRGRGSLWLVPYKNQHSQRRPAIAYRGCESTIVHEYMQLRVLVKYLLCTLAHGLKSQDAKHTKS